MLVHCFLDCISSFPRSEPCLYRFVYTNSSVLSNYHNFSLIVKLSKQDGLLKRTVKLIKANAKTIIWGLKGYFR